MKVKKKSNQDRPHIPVKTLMEETERDDVLIL